VDVPAQVIFAEVVIVLGASADDGVKRIQTEVTRFSQKMAERGILDAAPQSPDGIDEGQTGHLVPGGAEVPNLMLMRGEGKIQRRVANEHGVVRERSHIIGGEGFELRFQPALGEQHPQQLNAGERGGIAVDLGCLAERLAVSQQDTLHLAQGGDGNSIQDIVAVVEEDLDHADQSGVQFVALKQPRQFGRRRKADFLLQPASQWHRVEISHRADPEGSQRLFEVAFPLQVSGALLALIAVGALVMNS